PSELGGNQTFKGVKDLIPGQNDAGKLNFITESFEATKRWMDGFVSSKGLTQSNVADNLSKFIDFSEDKLDYLGALLDVSVKYYRHTGVQTLTRRLVERAVAEI
ncbi:hypothetical protein C7B61_16390, partial [filamentous cyanobacterium CCP1]